VKFSSNKITDISEFYLVQLGQIYSENESRVVLDMIFEEFFQISRIDRATNPDLRLAESEMLKVHFALKQLLKNKPVQYVLNKCFFYGLSFYVDERVLIPRPETEELVDLILKNPEIQNKKVFILDIGTGSGCIAISLKNGLPESQVWAMDQSRDALDVAWKNAATVGVEINLVEDNILLPSKLMELPALDVVVSNPPYVCQSEKALMKPNVLDYEPPVALFVNDDDPLVFYKRIRDFSLEKLKPGGYLFFEINQAFGNQVAELLQNAGFENVDVLKDISGNDRLISARKLGY
jgi:release factor glutamine methyltransferase